MEEKKKLYISLPITGYDMLDRMEYAAIAETRAANQLKRLHPEIGNVQVINPFSLTKPNDDYEECMRKCINALVECDFMMLCAGWRNSNGCREEKSVADDFEIETFEYEEEEQA